MKLYGILFVFLVSSVTCIAQPVWSPEVRAERENKWMKDSLLLSTEKLKRAYDISLSYYRQLDLASESRNKVKMQQRVMDKKDANMKPMLDKKQYQKYYRREKELRRVLNIKYEGRHQPY